MDADTCDGRVTTQRRLTTGKHAPRHAVVPQLMAQLREHETTRPVMTHPNSRGMQLDLQSRVVPHWSTKAGLTELDPQNTTPPTALMYREAVARPTHAFLPTVTMFWPHSCRLSREIWRSGAGSDGLKFSLAAALHHAATRGAAVTTIALS